MDPTASISNLKIAMSAAEKFFGLEQYLEPKDVAKLDEKSALVYVSEYYYGVNEQAKRVLAAKRISKLITFTTVNDGLRSKYAADAIIMTSHLVNAEALLLDVSSVDNTLAGARKRVDDFNRYKGAQKGPITGLEVSLEETLNTLALRLQQNNRPVFTAKTPETSLASLRSRAKAVFAKEVVEPSLYAELNRQQRLVELNKAHLKMTNDLTSFVRKEDAYVKSTVAVSSSGEARKQLRLFDAFVKGRQTTYDHSFADLKVQGAKLAKEKYEFQSAVAVREKELEEGFSDLVTSGKQKKPVLDDNLERELLKEKVIRA